MNKNLFNTRMNSVKHYLKEIEDLEAAERVTKQTLKDLVESFIEFVPFKSGDIILNGNQVFAVHKVCRTELGYGQIRVIIEVLYPKVGGGYGNSKYGCPGTEQFYLKELDAIKIIYSKPDDQC